MSTGIVNEELKQAGMFLRVLFGPYSEGFAEIRYLLKTGGQNARKQDFIPLPFTPDSLRATAAKVLKYSDGGWDCYAGVLPRSKRDGHAESILQAAWIWADLDHKNMTPEEIDGAVMGADMVVNSGNGTHAYWFLGAVRELSGSARDRFVAGVERVQADVSDGRADNTADLPRILRIPGTANWKDEADPKPVALLRYPSIASQKPQPEAKGALVATDSPERPAEAPSEFVEGEATWIAGTNPDDDEHVERLLLRAWQAMEAGTLPAVPFRLSVGVMAPDPGLWLRKARERRARLFKLRGRGWWEVGEGQRLAHDLVAFAHWFLAADLSPLLEVG